MGSGPPPMGGASPQLGATAVPPSPAASMHSGGGIPDDGFVTTVGNPTLAKEYGNQNTTSVNGVSCSVVRIYLLPKYFPQIPNTKF